MSTSTAALCKEDYTLQPFEEWWATNYDFLRERGYRLRDRYNPSVMDSWLVRGEIDDEEARRRGLLDKPDYSLSASKGMDAVRVRDGSQLWIKRCPLEHPDDGPDSVMELVLNAMIARDEDLHNHFLPFVDYFVVPDEKSWEFVKHNLRLCASTGMHGTSRPKPWILSSSSLSDIHPINILMSPTPIFYDGFDPLRNTMFAALADDVARAPYRDRIEVPARYWYIDLGLSCYFTVGTPHQVTWPGGVLKLPEVFGTTDPSDDDELNPPQVTYDAFAGDVWQLGTTLRMFFGKSIPSLNPLLRAMTDWEPSKRPTADQCLAEFHARTDNLPRWQLLLPVRDASFAANLPGLEWDLRLRFMFAHYREWFRLARKAIRLGLPKPTP
ncbi:hypothetical protein EXIGLDRAFT_744341 [Exidia glandulosa HHB12029]|uniref:Protein kinase domain-containing protein n=1 Tax=Exidia glandulosa HHB12029 TaxID=1314781 RepID=A0A165PY54_EXIGL|nr:hypothetical protein EXIGLDRAFT_744341 [Exidia glandulosa HHB12029]